jgi:hypothetical protein
MKRFIIHKHDALRREGARVWIDNLDPNRKWSVEIKEYRKKRSNAQNDYIHAVPLPMLSEHTGYTVEDIKEWLCGEWTGWEDYTVLGKVLQRPVKTTSQMDTLEMTKFIEFMQWYASTNLNMYIPSPNEWDGEY